MCAHTHTSFWARIWIKILEENLFIAGFAPWNFNSGIKSQIRKVRQVIRITTVPSGPPHR